MKPHCIILPIVLPSVHQRDTISLYIARYHHSRRHIAHHVTVFSVNIGKITNITVYLYNYVTSQAYFYSMKKSESCSSFSEFCAGNDWLNFFSVSLNSLVLPSWSTSAGSLVSLFCLCFFFFFFWITLSGFLIKLHELVLSTFDFLDSVQNDSNFSCESIFSSYVLTTSAFRVSRLNTVSCQVKHIRALFWPYRIIAVLSNVLTVGNNGMYRSLFGK